MTFLADSSALVRIIRGEVGEAWNDAVDRGLVALCEPVICEVMTVARAGEYEATELKLRRSYSWVPTPENPWAAVASLRQALAAHGAHQGLSVADYMIVATAIKSKLVLLHEDADFETVARVMPELQQQRISEVS